MSFSATNHRADGGDASVTAGAAGEDGSPESRRFWNAAFEGAHLRSCIQLVDDDRSAGLAAHRLRSLVVLAADELAAACAAATVALVEPLQLPVVVTRRLPAYAGPLDAVVLCGEPARADAPGLEEDCATAARRGCPMVLAGPVDGPVVEDAPKSAVRLDPPAGAGTGSPARTMGAVTTLLELVAGQPQAARERIELAAGAVEEELAGLSPQRDEVVNPARGLAEFVAGARVMHTGAGPVGRAVAPVVAALWNAHGMFGGAAGPDRLAAVAPVRDIFHDPLIDGDDGLLPLRVVVWAAEETGLPDAIAQDAPDVAGAGPAARALRLITRGFAATAFDRR